MHYFIPDVTGYLLLLMMRLSMNGKCGLDCYLENKTVLHLQTQSELVERGNNVRRKDDADAVAAVEGGDDVTENLYCCDEGDDGKCDGDADCDDGDDAGTQINQYSALF